MMTQYKELFSIEIKHGFFPASVILPMNIHPDQETQTALKQFGGTFKQQENKAYLLVPNHFTLSSEMTFCFNLVFQEPSFPAITQMPMNQLGVIAFDTQSVDVVNEQKVLMSTFTEKPITNYNASIELTATDLDMEGNNNFLAQFKARALPWRYYFINSSNPTQSIRLQGEQANLFSEPSTTTLSNGQEATVFNSGENELLLQQQSTVTLSLVDASSNNTLIEQLPTANPNTIQQEDQKIYSAIYVYL